jgi:hypothetical protein
LIVGDADYPDTSVQVPVGVEVLETRVGPAKSAHEVVSMNVTGVDRNQRLRPKILDARDE